MFIVGSDELKEILVQKRKELNLSQLEVVELSGASISRQYYGMIENGERRPSVDVAKKISSILNIKWTIFFETKSN